VLGSTKLKHKHSFPGTFHCTHISAALLLHPSSTKLDLCASADYIAATRPAAAAAAADTTQWLAAACRTQRLLLASITCTYQSTCSTPTSCEACCSCYDRTDAAAAVAAGWQGSCALHNQTRQCVQTKRLRPQGGGRKNGGYTMLGVTPKKWHKVLC
jgi:hypothetical protein